MARVRELLGDVSLFESPPAWEITHEQTSIQLGCFEGGWWLSVPYHSEGDEAAKIVERLYEVAAIVQDETGLNGYDPQLERPTTGHDDATASQAARVFDRVAEYFRNLGSGR